MRSLRLLLAFALAGVVFACTEPVSPKPAMFPPEEHGAGHGGHDTPVKPEAKPHSKAYREPVADDFPVPPPPFSEGVFPCSECHSSFEPDPTRRELSEHTEIKLEHGPRERWCFDCHNPGDRDQLRLASGALVPFSESYRLCGQCHGDKFRDWRVGVHGKRTGMWNGKKQYLLCAHCHNPHSPRFQPLEPMPPPTAPEHIRLKGGER